MLYIKGATLEVQESLPNMLLHPDTIFKYYHTEEWLNSDFGRGLITDIDKVDVMDKSKPVVRILLEKGLVLDNLATGTKNVLLCKYFVNPRDHSVPLYNRMGFMGENCFKWLLQAAVERDIYMVTTVFRNFDEVEFPEGGCVIFMDTGYVAKTGREVSDGMIGLCGKGILEA